MTETMTLILMCLVILSLDVTCDNIKECNNTQNKGCCQNYFRNKDGECQACRDGFFGIECNGTCPVGYYGHLCYTKCNCTDNLCHNVNGCLTGHVNTTATITTTLPSDSDDESTPIWMMVTFSLIGSLSTIAIIAFFVYMKSCLARNKGIATPQVGDDADLVSNQERGEIQEANRDSEEDKSGSPDLTEYPYTEIRYSTFYFDEPCGACGGLQLSNTSLFSTSCISSRSENNDKDNGVGYEQLKNNYNYNILSLRKNVNVTTIPPSHFIKSVDKKVSIISCIDEDYTMTHESVFQLQNKEDISALRKVETLPRMTSSNIDQIGNGRLCSLAMFTTPSKSRNTNESAEIVLKAPSLQSNAME